MEHAPESNGWRQGSLVRTEDVPALVADLDPSVRGEGVVVIVSQSCGIAQPVSTEPRVEAIIADYIDAPNGNYTFARNAGILDLPVKEATDTLETSCEKYSRLRAAGKLSISKSRFVGLRPTARKAIPRVAVAVLADWLAARYSRPAFPTSFNDTLASVDPRGKKLKRIAKRISQPVSGVYVQLHPDRELLSGERYSVNLLGTLIPSAKGRKGVIQKDIESIRDLMKEAGMEAVAADQVEDELSIATTKLFKRLYLDNISYRNDDSLPVEVSREHRGDTD